MLRFSYYRSDDREEWSLFGRLVSPWADELRTVWRRIRQHVPRARAVIDLKDVTSIDEAGRRLLAEMQRAGARLVTAGIEHQRPAADLKNGRVGSLRRRIGHLGGDRP
jgi:ABC-type transporter Mla MlaB component